MRLVVLMTCWMSLLLYTQQTQASSQSNVLHPYVNKIIPEEHEDYVLTTLSLRGCRSRCANNATCRGVTVTSQHQRVMTCSFTITSEITESQLSDVNASDSSIHILTYLKPLPCTGDFFVVEGVGCISVSLDFVPCGDAQSGCPNGSSLVSPHTDVIYWKLVDYIKENYVIKNHDIFHVDLKLEGETWTWGDGHTHTSDKGDHLWGPLDPDSAPSTCAGMAFYPPLGYYGHLADINEIKELYRYICMIQ